MAILKTLSGIQDTKKQEPNLESIDLLFKTLFAIHY